MTKVEAVAALFRAYPGQWLSALDLMRVGGALSWRTRAADCRRPPYNMTIENRVTVGKGGKVSEYRLVP